MAQISFLNLKQAQQLQNLDDIEGPKLAGEIIADHDLTLLLDDWAADLSVHANRVMKPCLKRETPVAQALIQILREVLPFSKEIKKLAWIRSFSSLIESPPDSVRQAWIPIYDWNLHHERATGLKRMLSAIEQHKRTYYAEVHSTIQPIGSQLILDWNPPQNISMLTRVLAELSERFEGIASSRTGRSLAGGNGAHHHHIARSHPKNSARVSAPGATMTGRQLRRYN
ncbi:hypothetical protein OIO90_006289 [Microbotryomycetes sp. JL221]|nr:hypothetical protein OIO90_006289 [Microbotryomycetes sp. JL221]